MLNLEKRLIKLTPAASPVYVAYTMKSNQSGLCNMPQWLIHGAEQQASAVAACYIVCHNTLEQV